MIRRLFLLSCIILTLVFVDIAGAVNCWWNGSINSNFNNPNNYDRPLGTPDGKPDSTTGINWAMSGVGASNPIIVEPGDTCLCGNMWAYGGEGGGNLTWMEINPGGSLTIVAGSLTLGSGAPVADGLLKMTGGTMHITGDLILGRFLSGSSTGTGIIDVSGSGPFITVDGWMYIPHASVDGKGLLKIGPGAIVEQTDGTKGLSMRAGGQLDIAGGTLILKGNKVSTVNNYIASGLITAFGYKGTDPRVSVSVSHNAGTDKTTVTALSHAAWNPSPADGARDVSPYVNLIWSPGDYYSPTQGYDVYFGTDYDDVNDAIDPYSPPGQGHQDVNVYNPSPLDVNSTYYWRIDEVNGIEVVKSRVWRFTTVPSVPPIDCYFSTGDNQWFCTWLPLESPNGIAASFDLLKDLFGVRRIYWRGMQELQFFNTTIPFREGGHPRWISGANWVRHLVYDVDIEQLAVQAAHDRGMEIWGMGNLMDHGCTADTPGLFIPFFYESIYRAEHPEWVPVDKHGVRRQGGPFEFSYPEVRQILKDLYTDITVNTGYDGVCFLTYAENYGMRYADEYGFNDPIVDEFYSRYGVNIRSEPFDKEDWYALRSEYLTQFLQELKDELSTHDKKLGMPINSEIPNRPLYVSGYTVYTAGNIDIDYEGWISNGVVDELMAYGGGGAAATAQMMAQLAQGTSVEISFGAGGIGPYAYPDVHLPTVIMSAEEENHLLVSKIPYQPLSALSDPDVYKRMRVLAQIIAGHTSATVADVSPLTSDSNLLVRRLALRAIGKIGDPAGVPIIEQGLEDSDGPVRNAAVSALYDIRGPNTLDKLVNAIDNYGTHMLNDAAGGVMMKCEYPSYTAVRQQLATLVGNHPNPMVRETASFALRAVMATDVVPAVIDLMNDNSADYAVRYYMAEALGSVGNSPPAIQALIDATELDDVAISERAAMSLGVSIGRNDTAAEARRADILNALGNLYKKLARWDCQRSDVSWGYRPIGNALLDMGADGQALLESFYNQRANMRLAQMAWMTLYIPQKVGQFMLVTEAEDDAAFALRPAAFGLQDLAQFSRQWLESNIFP